MNLYYNRARYLDVRTGRFWTMDPFEGDPEAPASLHKYLYAHGDPVGKLDPSGKTVIDLAMAFAGIAVIATLSYAAYDYYLRVPSISISWRNDFSLENGEQLTSSEITIIKTTALNALTYAFRFVPFPRIFEGSGGNYRILVLDDLLGTTSPDSDPKQVCGKASYQVASVSYECAARNAPTHIRNGTRAERVPSIGWAIGNFAAHEMGHLLFLSDMDSGPANMYEHAFASPSF